MRGIVAVLTAMALFVLSDTVVKLAGDLMPPTQIMALRGVIAVALMGAIAASSVPMARWHLVLQPRVLLRAAIEALVAVLFLASLPHLPLADITAIQQVTPLVLTMLSALLLRESVGWRRWSAVVAGFAGVVLVIQPVGQGINIYALSALACAVGVAVRDLVTRGLDPAIPTTLVSFTTTLSVCVTGFAGQPLETWTAPSTYAMTLLAASAVLVSSANLFVISAFRGTDISAVAPFRYAGVIWAIILGFLIWGHIANALAILGTVILISSGLYIMHREASKMRRAASATEVVPDPHG